VNWSRASSPTTDCVFVFSLGLTFSHVTGNSRISEQVSVITYASHAWYWPLSSRVVISGEELADALIRLFYSMRS